MVDLTIIYQGHDIKLSDIDYCPGCQAKTNCLPEDSYPAESPEMDFTINTGNEVLDQILEENHRDKIEELAFEAIEDSIKADADERACQAYEESREERYYD